MRVLILAGAAAALAAAVALAFRPTGSAPEGAAPEMVAAAVAAAEPGDVLFKSGDGLWGRLAAGFSRHDDRYGHVGLVAMDGAGGLLVIHAGGDPVSGDGRVQTARLEDFLGASRAAALYRPRLDEAALAEALAYAEAALARGAPFDAAFSLDDENALYCTELVWRALSLAAGEDAAPEKSARAGKVYVALDDLQASPFLEPHWRWER